MSVVEWSSEPSEGYSTRWQIESVRFVAIAVESSGEQPSRDHWKVHFQFQSKPKWILKNQRLKKTNQTDKIRRRIGRKWRKGTAGEAQHQVKNEIKSSAAKPRRCKTRRGHKVVARRSRRSATNDAADEYFVVEMCVGGSGADWWRRPLCIYLFQLWQKWWEAIAISAR